jgi:hypothetical protein
MAKRIERTPSEVRAELQSWYLADLRPKLADAARSGKVTSISAVALDVELTRMLGISYRRFEEAA